MLRASGISHSLAFFKSMAHLTFPRHSPQTPAPTLHQYSQFGAGGTVELEDQLPSPAESTRSSLGREEFSRNLPLACAAHPSRSDSAPHCRSLRAGVCTEQSRSLAESGKDWRRIRAGSQVPSTLFPKKLRFSGKDPRSWHHTKPGFAKPKPKSLSARKGQHSRARGTQ